MTSTTTYNMKTREEIAAAAKANAAVFLPAVPPEILKPARRILEGYSGVALEEVEAHILAIVRLITSIQELFPSINQSIIHSIHSI